MFDEKLWEQFLQTAEKSEELGEVTPCPDGCMLIYTSGSTGKPKGVCYTDDALSQAMTRNLTLWNYGENSQNSIACSTASFSFSALMMEIFTPLSMGVTLHILGDSVRKDGKNLVNYITEQGVTHCFIPPQLLATITEPISCLKQVVTGSERLSNIDPKVLGFPRALPQSHGLDGENQR